VYSERASTALNVQISFVQRRRIRLSCLYLPALNARVLSVFISPGSSSSGATPEGSPCLLFKENAERSMSLPYGDAEADRIISSPVKGAIRARYLVVEYMIVDIRVDLR